MSSKNEVSIVLRIDGEEVVARGFSKTGDAAKATGQIVDATGKAFRELEQAQAAVAASSERAASAVRVA